MGACGKCPVAFYTIVVGEYKVHPNGYKKLNWTPNARPHPNNQFQLINTTVSAIAVGWNALKQHMFHVCPSKLNKSVYSNLFSSISPVFGG